MKAERFRDEARHPPDTSRSVRRGCVNSGATSVVSLLLAADSENRSCSRVAWRGSPVDTRAGIEQALLIVVGVKASAQRDQSSSAVTSSSIDSRPAQPCSHFQKSPPAFEFVAKRSISSKVW